jgi:hypothetical protein
MHSQQFSAVESIGDIPQSEVIAQADWVGVADFPPPATRPVVFNPAPAKVDEKEGLKLLLQQLTSRCPNSVANGSVQRVATWRVSLSSAIKLLRNARATGQQLRAAINEMERYEQ